MSNLKYSQEVRKKVLHAYLDDSRTTRSLSEEFNIPKATIVYWINEYRKECSLRGDGTVNANAYEELKRLRRQNLELKKENAFLKKSGSILCEGNTISKYQFIQNNYKEFGIRWLFRRFGIYLNTYYNYLKDRKKTI